MSLLDEKNLEQTYVMPTFARKPVEFVEGDGMYLTDSEGKRYIDFLSGIGVVSLGHCNPHVVKAITEQASKLIHVSNYFYIEKRAEVAEMLSSMATAEQNENADEPFQTFFSNSGAESNECAIKLARLYARKRTLAQGKPADEAPRTIVTLKGSFHGRTLATLSATAQPAKQESFQPLPAGFVAVPQNDIEALRSLFATQGNSICAVMVECIQGESGVHPCTQEFLQEIRTLTQDCNALMICDEVQCGCYRTGLPFAYQQFGILPDIVTVAKGIASGFPMGACLAKASIAHAFEPGDHGTTFGGSNLAIASAYAVLSELTKPTFGDAVKEVGTYLRERLSELPHTQNVRGYGLMVGADLDENIDAPTIMKKALEAGLVINATGPHTLRFLPPLICTREHVDEAIVILKSLLA